MDKLPCWKNESWQTGWKSNHNMLLIGDYVQYNYTKSNAVTIRQKHGSAAILTPDRAGFLRKWQTLHSEQCAHTCGCMDIQIKDKFAINELTQVVNLENEDQYNCKTHRFQRWRQCFWLEAITQCLAPEYWSPFPTLPHDFRSIVDTDT